MKRSIPIKLNGRPRSKYRAVPTVVDNIRFASKKEARRYQELKLLADEFKVAVLRTQQRFPLNVNGHTIGHYVADFTYYEDNSGGLLQLKAEDVKGFKTPLYRWKKKHFEAQYGLKIQEV